MRTVLIAAGLLALPFITPVRAESWRSVELQCADEINRQAHCASCGGEWPNWVRCTNERLGRKVPPDKLEACIQHVWNIRLQTKMCAMCGDPTLDAWLCAGGQ